MFLKMSNSVGDSLERCRNALRLVLEGEQEEEDYLVKASRYVPPSDGEAKMEPDPAIDPIEQLDHPELSDLITALHKSIDASHRNGEVVVDDIEELVDDCPTFKITLSTTEDESDLSMIVSDAERMLDGKMRFVSSKRQPSDGSATTVDYVVAFDGDVEESVNRIGFRQKHIRLRKPKQIRRAKRCIRDNKFMRKNFRRKYFAKRKLLIGG